MNLAFLVQIQSVRAKFDQNNLEIKTEFGAICLQECTFCDDLTQTEIKGYTLIPHGRSSSTKGGLIIYLHEKFDYDYKLKLNKYKSWEGQVIQIKKRENLTKPLNIANFYRPPNELIDSYNEFIREISPMLEQLENNKNEVIIAGDFNIYLLKINDKHVISEYFDALTSHTFYLNITLLLDFQTIMEH